MAMKSTKDAVRAICAADPSVNTAQVKAALADLDGEGIREMQGEAPQRAYSRQQVATLLGVRPRAITQYAKRGLLTPIYGGADGRRATGYTGESVAALLAGKATAAGRGECEVRT